MIKIDDDDHNHCLMCGRHYDDHPACWACDSTEHETPECPLVYEYDERNRRGEM